MVNAAESSKNNSISEMFRALCVPGWPLTWHKAIRVTKSRKMVGFVSGMPIRMKVYDK